MGEVAAHRRRESSRRTDVVETDVRFGLQPLTVVPCVRSGHRLRPMRSSPRVESWPGRSAGAAHAAAHRGRVRRRRRLRARCRRAGLSRRRSAGATSAPARRPRSAAGARTDAVGSGAPGTVRRGTHRVSRGGPRSRRDLRREDRDIADSLCGHRAPAGKHRHPSRSAARSGNGNGVLADGWSCRVRRLGATVTSADATRVVGYEPSTGRGGALARWPAGRRRCRQSSLARACERPLRMDYRLGKLCERTRRARNARTGGARPGAVLFRSALGRGRDSHGRPGKGCPCWMEDLTGGQRIELAAMDASDGRLPPPRISGRYAATRTRRGGVSLNASTRVAGEHRRPAQRSRPSRAERGPRRMAETAETRRWFEQAGRSRRAAAEGRFRRPCLAMAQLGRSEGLRQMLEDHAEGFGAEDSPGESCGIGVMKKIGDRKVTEDHAGRRGAGRKQEAETESAAGQLRNDTKEKKGGAPATEAPTERPAIPRARWRRRSSARGKHAQLKRPGPRRDLRRRGMKHRAGAADRATSTRRDGTAARSVRGAGRDVERRTEARAMAQEISTT